MSQVPETTPYDEEQIQKLNYEEEPSVHHIHIEGNKVPLHKVLHAYAGLARAGTYYAPSRNLPSMAPTGLIGFAMPAMFLGFMLTGARGIAIPNLIVPSAWFVGAIGLGTGGTWEFFLENTNGSTILWTYALFWWPLAAFYTPSFGITEKYLTYCNANIDMMPSDFSTVADWATAIMTNTMGYWMLAWAIFAFLPVLTLLKSTVAFFGCLFFVFLLLLMICIGYLVPSTGSVKACGVFSVIAAVAAEYNAFAGIMTKENSYVVLKPIYIPPGPKGDVESQNQ